MIEAIQSLGLFTDENVDGQLPCSKSIDEIANRLQTDQIELHHFDLVVASRLFQVLHRFRSSAHVSCRDDHMAVGDGQGSRRFHTDACNTLAKDLLTVIVTDLMRRR